MQISLEAKSILKQYVKVLRQEAKKAGIPLTTNYAGGMFGFFFTEEKNITTYEQATKCDAERFKRFFHLMLEEGVYLAPSAYETGFVCTEHGDEEIKLTIEAAARVFAKL